MMKRINVADYIGYWPYWYYANVPLNAPRAFFLNSVPAGTGFLLRRITCKYPDVDSGVTQFNPDLLIEFFDTSSFKARQDTAIPLNVISTYNNNVRRNSSPVAPAVYPAGCIKSSVPLNFYYPYGDTINIQITGQSGGNPASIDIVLHGYFIQENECV